MNRRHRFLAGLGPLGLLVSCSPAPAATRGNAHTSATPRADAGPDATVPQGTTTSTGPATSSTVAAVLGRSASTVDPNVTVVTINGLPAATRATTSTTFAVPERAGESMGDVEWLVRQTFPEDPERGVRIARRESGLRPGADENWPYVGVMQINVVLHAKLIASLGYTRADLYHAVPNLVVARALFDAAGWLPWA